MTKFRRLSAVKVKRVRKTERQGEEIPMLKLMGLKKKNTEKQVSQIKLNEAAVKYLGVKAGDQIDILAGEGGELLVAKVDKGRTLSASKNTNTLSVTFAEAYNKMKEISYRFEITSHTFVAENDDQKAVLGDSTWYVLEAAKEEEKIEEKLVEEEVNN